MKFSSTIYPLEEIFEIVFVWMFDEGELPIPDWLIKEAVAINGPRAVYDKRTKAHKLIKKWAEANKHLIRSTL